MWLAESGGFAAPEAPIRFARYAAACVEALGDMVTWWVTVNEPNIVALMGWVQGKCLLRLVSDQRHHLRRGAGRADHRGAVALDLEQSYEQACSDLWIS